MGCGVWGQQGDMGGYGVWGQWGDIMRIWGRRGGKEYGAVGTLWGYGDIVWTSWAYRARGHGGDIVGPGGYGVTEPLWGGDIGTVWGSLREQSEGGVTLWDVGGRRGGVGDGGSGMGGWGVWGHWDGGMWGMGTVGWGVWGRRGVTVGRGPSLTAWPQPPPGCRGPPRAPPVPPSWGHRGVRAAP